MKDFRLNQHYLPTLLFYIAAIVIQIFSENECVALCATHHEKMQRHGM